LEKVTKSWKERNGMFKVKTIPHGYGSQRGLSPEIHWERQERKEGIYLHSPYSHLTRLFSPMLDHARFSAGLAPSVIRERISAQCQENAKTRKSLEPRPRLLSHTTGRGIFCRRECLGPRLFAYASNHAWHFRSVWFPTDAGPDGFVRGSLLLEI